MRRRRRGSNNYSKRGTPYVHLSCFAAAFLIGPCRVYNSIELGSGSPTVNSIVQFDQLLGTSWAGFLALGIFVSVLVQFWFSSGFSWFCFGSVLVHKHSVANLVSLCGF